VAAVERALTPRTRLLLVSQVSAWSGLVLPVAEISRLARARGVEVLVDGAQSFGLLDTSMPALGCDYFGTSLHKWLGAPLGSGMLCLRKERVASLWPLFPDARDGWESLRKLSSTGTTPDTVFFAVADAARAHAAVGAERLAARLAFLTRRWVDTVQARIPVVAARAP
jgi:selenocysteine lyase/cysteine desulfurase